MLDFETRGLDFTRHTLIGITNWPQRRTWGCYCHDRSDRSVSTSFTPGPMSIGWSHQAAARRALLDMQIICSGSLELMYVKYLEMRSLFFLGVPPRKKPRPIRAASGRAADARLQSSSRPMPSVLRRTGSKSHCQAFPDTSVPILLRSDDVAAEASCQAFP